MENELIQDNFTPSDWKSDSSIIKVIGVGGGGCNAVNYMFAQKISGCSFIVCNTDEQALSMSPVPTKIHLGQHVYGAGTDPVKGRNAAIESQEDLKAAILDDHTEVLFITASMGGGTGTGAAPVIAKMAKEANILTIAVVTIPFQGEGTEPMSRAVDGIRELEKNVDSMLVINNEKLYEFHGEKLIQDAFPKADEVLATAVRGITEIITRRGFINVDLQDVMTMMRNSGMALMGIGTGTGENRIQDAVKGALESPLLNDFDLKTAKYVLAIITVGRNAQGVVMNELNDINQMINEYTGDANNFKRGIIYDDDPAFGDRVNITAIAVGFKMADLSRIANVNLGNIILIEPDFTYTPGETPAPEEEGEGGYFRTIGFNTAENVRKFHYKENEKPVLLAGLNGSRAELETTPAIRRRPGSQTTKTE